MEALLKEDAGIAKMDGGGADLTNVVSNYIAHHSTMILAPCDKTCRPTWMLLWLKSTIL